ncbi:short-chain dehydrogenase [Moorena producens PAL-8-15-08-1]|uniref:Short-chain dehydrogenase n=1 Tax=Moorena producens PAL-8-15-08-1 TaxID=1458985 RepID=A0A1D8TX05_9CYAN|nr:SDR family oxidoreductase [Moorena producens]AOX02180.1 short-chain dehydrogenase [Moorena producens PAL-8-15-08-1]
MSSKVAIVTGGTRGIGFGISEQLAADGYDLILGFNSNETAAANSKKTLESDYGVKVYTVKGDVAQPETVDKFFECLENNFGGKLTALIHNAGLHVGMTTSPASEQAELAANSQLLLLGDGNLTSLAAYEYYQNVYPKCFIRCVEKAVKYMEDGQGYIVATSSPGCNMNQTPRLNYIMPGTGKTVVEFLTRYYAKLLASRQITVNVVIPGFTKTEAWNAVTANSGGVDSEMMQKRIKSTPMQRWCSPTEVGQLVAFLCSPKAAFITGVALPIDGGLHLQ